MNKKGFISMHPGIFFILGLIVGAVLMYFLLSKGTIPTGLLPF